MTVLTMSAAEITWFDTLIRLDRGEIRIADGMAEWNCWASKGGRSTDCSAKRCFVRCLSPAVYAQRHQPSFVMSQMWLIACCIPVQSHASTNLAAAFWSWIARNAQAKYATAWA